MAEYDHPAKKHQVQNCVHTALELLEKANQQLLVAQSNAGPKTAWRLQMNIDMINRRIKAVREVL